MAGIRLKLLEKHPIRTLLAAVCAGFICLVLLVHLRGAIPGLLTILGIRAATNVDNFLISFWSGLISGTLYSLLIGAIVGILVGRYISATQKELEEKRERRLAKIDVDEVIRRVRSSTKMPRHFDSDSAINCIPTDISASLAAITTSGAPAAAAILGEDVPAASVLSRANELYFACIESARELDRQLQVQVLHAIPVHIAQTGTGTGIVVDYVFRKILHEVPHLNQPAPPGNPPDIVKTGENLLQVPRIAPLFAHFKATMTELVSHYEDELKPALQNHQFGLNAL